MLQIESRGERRELSLAPTGPLTFNANLGEIHYGLEYRPGKDRLLILATVRHSGPEARGHFWPTRISIRLGIDTYMESCPQWDLKYFPTLLRCERTHFWGYLMTPLGRVLGIASPDPVASWGLEYAGGGHRIWTFRIDLVHVGPLPERHPEPTPDIAGGFNRCWKIALVPVEGLDALKPALALACDAPMLSLERHTVAPGAVSRMRIFSPGRPAVRATAPSGRETILDPQPDGAGVYVVSFPPEREFGVHKVDASLANGKRSEGMLYVRRPWSWYLQQARKEAVRIPQKASTNMESWLGHFSTFLARRHFPFPQVDAAAERNFRIILPLMFDLGTGEPKIHPGRIQNVSAMIGLLCDVYSATGKTADLELAGRMATVVIGRQAADGSYRTALAGGNHYTSVSYMAKYMLELAVLERQLADKDDRWSRPSRQHYASAKAAIADLERRLDDVGTEGEHTFEDGMISCTAAQLAHFALLQSDPVTRKRYADAAARVLTKHRCLQQTQIPDCRMNGATLRFWEAQYDVLMTPNMMNSPHGWTSWKTYATWYLYLLTGNAELLRDTMDTLAACVQSIDSATGRLRWAFVPDPFVRASVLERGSGRGIRTERIIGEQYIEMISDWFLAPEGRATGGHWDQGGCCDNDVHEHFKCLEEVALTSAYVVERSSGGFDTWNCMVENAAGVLHVNPEEQIVSRVHLNLRSRRTVVVHVAGQRGMPVHVEGLSWAGPGGVPPDLRVME